MAIGFSVLETDIVVMALRTFKEPSLCLCVCVYVSVSCVCVHGSAYEII